MGATPRAIKRAALGIHKLGARFGIYVLPVHYHSAITNIPDLQGTRGEWARQSELPGLSVNLDEQATSLKAICKPYQREYEGNKTYNEGVSRHFGPGYGYIEAQALHGFIRHFKPRRIVEVGSGVSTYCMLRASEMNAGESGEMPGITAIEPNPSTSLTELPGIQLLPRRVQTVSLDVFTELGENDLLFIDSSHTVKAGGDVNFLILEVLPRLRKGVIVHFHDIYLPYDYQPDTCATFLQWAETSLLHAFLIFNERAGILVSLSHLHYERQEVLRDVFPEYSPRLHVDGLNPDDYKPFEPIAEHFPSSTYIRIL